MLVSNAIEQAELITDTMLEDNEWVMLLNMCLDDLTPIAKFIKEKDNISVPFSGGEARIDLTNGELGINDIYEVRTVYVDSRLYRKLPYWDRYSKGWKQGNNEIIICNPDAIDNSTATVKLIYYARLPHVSVENITTENIPLPEEYCNLAVLYMAAKSQQNEEEIEDEKNFWQLYLQGKQQFAYDRIWVMEPENRKLIRSLRIQAHATTGK